MSKKSKNLGSLDLKYEKFNEKTKWADLTGMKNKLQVEEKKYEQDSPEISNGMKKTFDAKIYSQKDLCSKKVDISHKKQKREISPKKATNEEKYKDLIKPSSNQDVKKPEFKNEKYTQKPIESYEKKLIAEEKPNNYQQFEFEFQKEKLKKAVELKSHDFNRIEALRKKKDDLELQVKDLTNKLNVVQRASNEKCQSENQGILRDLKLSEDQKKQLETNIK